MPVHFHAPPAYLFVKKCSRHIRSPRSAHSPGGAHRIPRSTWSTHRDDAVRCADPAIGTVWSLPGECGPERSAYRSTIHLLLSWSPRVAMRRMATSALRSVGSTPGSKIEIPLSKPGSAYPPSSLTPLVSARATPRSAGVLTIAWWVPEALHGHHFRCAQGLTLRACHGSGWAFWRLAN